MPDTRRPLDPAAVEAGLRRLARQAAPPWLHAEAARRMAARLPVIRLQPTTVVDWWGFGGASEAVLAAAYPKARRVAVEPTEALMQRSLAVGEAPWWSARRWTQGPQAQCADPAPATAQLLWANMMLHAVADPLALFARWQRALAVDGFVMFSCLGPGSLVELRSLYRALGWAPAGAELVDMHDLGDMLVQAGFADPVMDQERLTLTWDSPQAALLELRALGCNASPQRFQGMRTPRWHAYLVERLGSLAGPQGRIGLSFELVYGHAFKAAPRPALQGETNVSLEDMRAMVRSGRGARS